MQLDKIGDRKTALFIIISDTDATFNFLVAMLHTQMFNLLCTKADNNPDGSGKLKHHVRCLLDEFANIGQIPDFDKLIATIRSREISACIILQAQSQLKRSTRTMQILSWETAIPPCSWVAKKSQRSKRSPNLLEKRPLTTTIPPEHEDSQNPTV